MLTVGVVFAKRGCVYYSPLHEALIAGFVLYHLPLAAGLARGARGWRSVVVLSSAWWGWLSVCAAVPGVIAAGGLRW
ncbi:hypothetical protein J0H58_27550 [bacterium]|nr:hypothetical protein [bacterium]